MRRYLLGSVLIILIQSQMSYAALSSRQCQSLSDETQIGSQSGSRDFTGNQDVSWMSSLKGLVSSIADGVTDGLIDGAFIDRIEKAHDSLFDVIMISDQELLQRDPSRELVRIKQKIKLQLWCQISQRSDVKKGLLLLSRPAFLRLALDQKIQDGSEEQISKAFQQANQQLDQFLKSTENDFSEMPVEKRRELFQILQTSSAVSYRKLAMSLRSYYTVFTYGHPELLDFLKVDRNRKPIINKDFDLNARLAQLKFPKSQLTLDYDRRELTLNNRIFDVVIIGSGPAGSALAKRLIEQNKKVLLLDQGPLLIPGGQQNGLVKSLFENESGRLTQNASVFIRNGSAAGGGAAVNVDLAFDPTHELVQERLNRLKADGSVPDSFWPLKSVKPSYDWIKATIKTRTPEISEINRNNRILWDGARASGLNPDLYDLNNRLVNGEAVKNNPLDYFIFPAMLNSENNLYFLPRARVEKISLKSRTGVTERDEDQVDYLDVSILPPTQMPTELKDPHGLKLKVGDRLKIRAKAFVLAGGAMGSAELLLKSGFNNKNIGRNIVLHPSIPLIGRFPGEKILINQGIPATVHLDDFALSKGFIFESMSADLGYGATMLRSVAPQKLFDLISKGDELGGFGVMLIDSGSFENRIELSGPSGLTISYKLTENDKIRFREGVAIGIRLLFAAGAKEVFIPTTEKNLLSALARSGGLSTDGSVYFNDPKQADLVAKYLEFEPSETTLTSAHFQGTLRVGRNQSDGVVDGNHQVFGTSNLFVAGTAVFRGSIGANPMQSSYTDGALLADQLIQNPDLWKNE